MLLPANRPANVLLVDDDEDVLESYCHLLRLSGYHPRATTSPARRWRCWPISGQGCWSLTSTCRP